MNKDWTIKAERVLADPATSAVLTISPNNKTMVTLRPDGSLEYGPDYHPDDAARHFWSAIQSLMPQPGFRPLGGYTTEELQTEISRRSQCN